MCARADTDQNPKRRLALYRQAAQIIRDDAPRIPIFVASDPELDKPYLHGLEDGLTGHLPYRNVTLR